MDIKTEISRGERAERLLKDELLIEAFETIDSAIIEKWRNGPLRDQEGAHELRLLMKCLTDLKGYIKEVVQTGKLARIGSEQQSNVVNM